MADPQFVRALLVPAYAALCPEDLHQEPVLAAGIDLADSVRAARPVAEVDQHGPEVFRLNWTWS